MCGGPRAGREWSKWLCIAMILALHAAVSAGCAAIPQDELSAYNAAISSAREAGENMTQDWEAAKAELERREQAKKPPSSQPKVVFPFPMTWTPPAMANVEQTGEMIRVLAWETIGEYTGILVALNAGESVEQVQSSVGRLYNTVETIATSVGGSIPGGGALVAIFKELGKQLEKARLAGEFKRAIRDGAPIVRKMLAVFQADAAAHYQLRASLANSDYESVDFNKAMDDEVKRLKKARIKASMEALKESIDDYSLLIDRTIDNLNAMEKKIDQPLDFMVEANRMLDIVITLKQHWSAYQNARNESNQ